jgi:hypothetical protein
MSEFRTVVTNDEYAYIRDHLSAEFFTVYKKIIQSQIEFWQSQILAVPKDEIDRCRGILQGLHLAQNIGGLANARASEGQEPERATIKPFRALVKAEDRIQVKTP